MARVWLRGRTVVAGGGDRSPARCTRTLLDPFLPGTPAWTSHHCAPEVLSQREASLRSSSYSTHCKTSPPASFFQEDPQVYKHQEH